MASPRRPSPLLLFLGVTLLAGHVIGQSLQLFPPHKEFVKYADESLVVSCTGRDGNMRWHGPTGQPINERTGAVRVETKSGDQQAVDLLLMDVKRKDIGTYTCRSSSGDRAEASFELVVLVRIQLKEDSKVQYAVQGEDKVLKCDVTGDPEPEVTWRGIPEMGPDKKYDIDPETRGLLIRDVTRQDETTYRCRATQVNKKNSDVQQFDIQLIVQYKPKWTSDHQLEAHGFLGGSANLSCQADAKPAAEFAWYRGNQLLERSDHLELFSTVTSDQSQPVNTITTSVLQISSLDDSMFGEYRCEARNQYDTISRTVLLRKGQKPAVPQVSVTKTESSRLSLSITVPPEEAGADRYRAEYRTADASWPAATAVEFQPGESHVISNLQPDTVYVIRVAAVNQAGRGDFSAGIRQRTAARRTSNGPASGSQPVVLSLLVALLMAALLVL